MPSSARCMGKNEFLYEAVAADGSISQGVISGASDREVVLRLARQGLTPLKISPSDQLKLSGRALNPQKVLIKTKKTTKISFLGLRFTLALPGNRTKDLIRFAESLGVLLDAGISLDKSLAISAELAKSERFSTVVYAIRDRVREGAGLAEALEAQGHLFPQVFIGMVQAGERGGVLESVLKRLSEYLSGVQELREYLISAMIYPIILALTSLGSMAVLLTLVIPKFSIIFEDLGVALPMMTRIMLMVGKFFQNWWWALFLGISVSVFLLWQLVRTSAGQQTWHALKLRLPMVGPLLVKMETARLAATLGTLLSNGVPILSAVQMGKQVVQNVVFAGYFDRVSQELKEGESFSKSLSAVPYFPAQAAHMVAVGEETGRLDSMLTRVAELYDRELKVAVKAFNALFEPVIILFMGLIIGAMVVSMLMAIFSLNQMEM